eukprot:11948939-Heterocapsa_arctica.AAC.1
MPHAGCARQIACPGRPSGPAATPAVAAAVEYCDLFPEACYARDAVRLEVWVATNAVETVNISCSYHEPDRKPATQASR